MQAKTPKEVFECLPHRPVARKDFLYADFTGERDGHTFMLNLNYCCEGPYGPEQMIMVPNVTLTVWSKGQMQTATRDLYAEEDLERELQDALKELEGACDHPNAREMSSDEARAAGMFTGNCYHNYKCPDCGAQFGLDTSS